MLYTRAAVWLTVYNTVLAQQCGWLCIMLCNGLPNVYPAHHAHPAHCQLLSVVPKHKTLHILAYLCCIDRLMASTLHCCLTSRRLYSGSARVISLYVLLLLRISDTEPFLFFYKDLFHFYIFMIVWDQLSYSAIKIIAFMYFLTVIKICSIV